MFERCLAHVQQPLTAPLPAIPGQGLWERLRTRAAAAPRNVLGNAGIRPYSRSKLRRFGVNAAAALAATVVIGAGVAVVMANRDKEPVGKVQTWMPDPGEGKRYAVVDKDAAIILSGKPATGPASPPAAARAIGPANQTAAARTRDQLWQEAVTAWQARQRKDEIAALVQSAQAAAEWVEWLLTAPRVVQKSDPIEAGIRRVAERIDALEEDVAPRVFRVEVHERHETKPQPQPRRSK